jgi:hypothetical protein
VSTDGALGLANIKEASTPVIIPPPQGKQIVQVSCSTSEHHTHSAAVTGKNRVRLYDILLVFLQQSMIVDWAQKLYRRVKKNCEVG